MMAAAPASTLASTLAIWRQPVAERRAQGNLGLTWCLLALFVLGTLSLLTPSPQRYVLFAMFTGIPMSMLLIMWWIYLCANVAHQCHPAALQLVPDLGRQVQRAVVLAWLAIVAIMTLLAGVPSGHAGVVAVVTALVLIEAGVMGNWIRYAVIGATWWALAHASPAVTESLRWFIATPSALLVGTVLVLLDGAMALRRLGRGNAPVLARRNALAALQERKGPGGRLAGWPEWGADSQPVWLQPLGRSWFSLHLFTIVVVVLLCAWLRFWATWKGHSDVHEFLAGYRAVLGLAACGVLACILYQEAHRFTRARTEQALLFLTPAAPVRSAIDGLLARAWLTGFVRSWLILWALTLLALVSLGAHWSELAKFSGGWLLALLPGAFGMYRWSALPS